MSNNVIEALKPFWPAVFALMFVLIHGCAFAACCSGYRWGWYLGLSLLGAWLLSVLGIAIMVGLG